MSIAAALLLIGACGSASRTIVVEPPIWQIVWQCVAGGFGDVVNERLGAVSDLRLSSVLDTGKRIWEMQFVLRIDGQQRTGVVAWAAAAYRVAGYAISNADDRTGKAGRSGSVEYTYRLRVRGYDVRRSTRISDGRVSLVTDVYGSIADGKLYHVRLTINAVEGANGTRIVGVATGDSEIGRNCRLISRIASRVIGDELDTELLGRVQAGGIDLYRAGSIAEVLR